METVIDCDIHPQIGDPEELLAYVTPAQRDWFRAQGGSLGLPGYSWAHPSSWFRQDIEQNGRPPASDVETVRSELLDPTGTDIGVLNGDDTVLVSRFPGNRKRVKVAGDCEHKKQI